MFLVLVLARAVCFDACCSKRWMTIRYAAPHHGGFMEVVAPFIFAACRLQPPPALKVNPIFRPLPESATARWCIATSSPILTVCTMFAMTILHCMPLLCEARLKPAVCCCSAMQI